MKKTFDVYCAGGCDLAAARLRVERALRVSLVVHESMYWGGEYYRVQTPDLGEVTVRPNFNSFTGALNERAFPDCRIVVSVSVPADPDRVKQQLLDAGLTFLKRTEVTR